MANRHGDFIWYELMTPDRPAAEAFYGPLVGWRFGGDESYRQIEAGEGHVGGLLQLTPEMTEHGAHPAWIGYILVEDVDATVQSTTSGGGQIHMPARDMDNVGRMAMVADPQGAPFYVMKPTPPADAPPDAESHAFSYDRPRMGHCAWNELATTDPAAAFHFYGPRFGWVKDGEMDMGPMGKYEFVRHAGHAPDGSPPGHGMLGAIYPKTPQMPLSAWMFYFRVPDIDAAADAIKAGGGDLFQEPTEIPGGDYSLNASDPQGAYFGLVGARH